MKVSSNSAKEERGYIVKHKLVLCFLVLLFLFDAVWCLKGVSMAASKESRCSMHDVAWSVVFGPDSDKLLFRHRCIVGAYENAKESDYSWAIYEISKNKISDFKELNNATPHQLKYQPAFSRDGKLITFVSGQDDHRNIYVMNADGTNVRQLTHDYNENQKRIDEKYIAMVFNEEPSFSPDGNRIIYVKSASKRTKPDYYTDPMYPTCWDIYEVNIEKVKERRLTNYGFSEIESPRYLSDGKHFIFGANLWASRGIAGTSITNEFFNEYYNKYKKNFIFIMDGKNNNLKPAFKNGSNSSEPQIAWDNAIIFKSNINEMDGLRTRGPNQYYDLFIYKNDEIKRIFNKQFYGNITYSVSPDGTCFLIRDAYWKIYNMTGHELAKIKIPLEQLDKLSGNKNK
jgi:dipeptidyl aminopeptidase/acylaminoacyl peptidase